MADSILSISNFSQKLKWSCGIKTDKTFAGRVRIPPTRAADIRDLKSLEQIQEFLKASGLKLLAEKSLVTETANHVAVCLPDDASAALIAHLVFPRLEGDKNTFGLVMLHFRLSDLPLPGPQAQEAAATELGKFQTIIESFSRVVQSPPFACLTGNGVTTPKHELQAKGYKFFFSPDPLRLYKLMTSILALDIRISVGPRLIDEANKKLAMIEQLNFLRSVYSNNSFTAHPILAEVKAEVSGTKLFALIKDQ